MLATVVHAVGHVDAVEGVGAAQDVAHLGIAVGEVADEQVAVLARDFGAAGLVASGPDAGGQLAIDSHHAVHVVYLAILQGEQMHHQVVTCHAVHPLRQFAEDAATVAHRHVGDGVAQGNVVDGHLVTLAAIAQALGAVGLVVVDHPVEAHGILRVAVEEVGLYLQLVAVGPEVVGLADGDVAAGGFTVGAHEVARQTHIVAVVEQPYAVGIALLPLAATLGGGIAAAIVADDEFVIEVGLLEHHTAYGLIDILLLVVGEHQHAHLDVSVHNVSFLSSKRMASLSILLPVA